MVRKFAGVKQGVVWTSEIGKKDNSRRNDYVQRDSLLLLSLSLSLARLMKIFGKKQTVIPY